MNIKSTNKLSAIIASASLKSLEQPRNWLLRSCVICGLTFLPLTVTAQNQIITTSTIETSESYHDVSDHSALDVRGSGVIYTGTDITLTATYNVIYSGTALANGAYVTDQATLYLTNGTVSTTGSYGYGISLNNTSTGTVNNVDIKTTGNSAPGVSAFYFSTLTLTGGTITTDGRYASGITLNSTSTGTVNNVNIKTIEGSSDGVYVGFSSLTLIGGSITTGGLDADGICLYGGIGTVNNVNIRTTGEYGNGVSAFYSSTLTLTDSDISATGNNLKALYITGSSTVTASLNKNTLTGNILVHDTSTLNLTGSNGTIITGDITGALASTVNLTLSGEDTRFVGNATRDSNSTVTLDISDGATLGDASTANSINGIVTIKDGGHISSTLTLSNGITLETGAILDYAGNSEGLLVTGGTINIADSGILVDFGGATMENDQAYIILDWNNTGGNVNTDAFAARNLDPDITGTFTVANNQLTFNATAIPEPSTYFLLGTGLGVLLLSARHRRRNAQS